jgi:hypothetical protein
MQADNANSVGKAGYSPAEWCRRTSISRAAFYALPVSLQPRSIKLGRRRIIIEDPVAYLTRLAQSQEAA